MKKLRNLIVLVVLIQFSVTGFAQGKYGKDSAECVKYLNFYKDSYKQDNMADAAPNWRKAIRICPPSAGQDMLFHGQKILKYLMSDPKITPAQKKSLLDSLILMYDMREQYYPKSMVSAQTYKVYDMNEYGVDDKTVFDEIEKTIDMAGESIEPGLLVIGMQKSVLLYQKKIITAEQVMSYYTKVSKIFEAQVNSSDSDVKTAATSAKKDFETLFANSGVASCENIVALYTPTFDANKGSKEYVTNVVGLLERGGCTKEDLFAKAVESLNTLEPSATTSYYLYRLYATKNEDETAVKFLQAAIDSPQTNDSTDASYLAELGAFYLSNLKNPYKAVEYAKDALQKGQSYINGKAYMLLASAWASLKCGNDEIESRAHFWVAVDYLMKAKAADPSIADEADKLIASYRQFFPLQEEAFMYNILDGNSYTVVCGGLRESTTVRTRK